VAGQFLLAFSLASEDRLDIVAIWIEYKCGVVVRPAQAGSAVFSPAGPEGGGVECIDLRPALGCKGGMLFDGVRVVSIDPEYGVIETIADAVGPDVNGHLHHPAHAKHFQSRVIKGGGAADVGDANASVVNQLRGQSSLLSIILVRSKTASSHVP